MLDTLNASNAGGFSLAITPMQCRALTAMSKNLGGTDGDDITTMKDDN